MLRNLPDRKAPAGLEARVLAEISRRAALPWWRKSFAHWPVAVRLGFLILSARVAAVAVGAGCERQLPGGVTVLGGIQVSGRFHD